MSPFEYLKMSYMDSLASAFQDGNVEILQKTYDTIGTGESDRCGTLDQVMREYLIQLLDRSPKDVAIWESYINLCIELCRRKMCTATMPVVLLGDVFDVLTLDHCEKLFAFVETGVNVWREEMFFSACKNNLLRMCNDLLRRLSRSQNTVFCGRILLFLAKFFPFSERSGLNIVSEFNLDNITEFGTEEENDLKDIFSEKDDGMEEGETSSDTRLKIDYNLYCKFWALQDIFRNPNQYYDKVHWKTFSTHASSILSAFSSFKLENHQGKKRKFQVAMGDEDEPTQQYFAKFLTNQKLLELQLSDSNFRRYVLLQFIILFQYLNCTVKFRHESLKLNDDQSDWVKETTEYVYKLLEETPPDGPTFSKAVKHILKREEHWNSWKNEGCPEFEKPSPPTPEKLAEEGGDKKVAIVRPRRSKKRLGDQIKEAANNHRYLMGNPELTKLWNLYPDNLDACRSKDRNFLPSLENYFQEAIEQLDPSSNIEDESKRLNDGNYGWRALRLLARRSPHFFTHTLSQIHKLPEYLENMVKKIAKDRPQLVSNDEAKQEVLESDVPGTNDGEVDEDELQEEDKEDERREEYEDGEVKRERVEMITAEQMTAVAGKVGSEWKKLAAKLGFTEDEIEYFDSEHPNDKDRARLALQIWKDDNEDDAIPANLAYMLEGLGFQEAAEVLVGPQ